MVKWRGEIAIENLHLVSTQKALPVSTTITMTDGPLPLLSVEDATAH